MPDLPVLRGPRGRPLRLAHLTTIDMSLELLLGAELTVDVEAGLETVAISAAGDYVAAVESRGVRHVRLDSLTRSWNVGSDARAARELLTVLRGLELDIVHTHTPKAGVLGRLLGRLAGIPVVVNTCHGLWFAAGHRWPRKAFVVAAEGAAAAVSHAELYQNGADRQVLRPVVAGDRAEVVGNGIDLARFRPDPLAGRAVRAELGVADDELVVGGVGRQVAEKGLAEFGAMARRLAGKARFVWVGPPDPARPDAADAGDAEGDANADVSMLGSRGDMPAVYAALDVFVLPSYREGFSRSAMEAAASGVPMVLSDIRGCREVGVDREHLLLVPPRDSAALTSAVERLLGDPVLRERLGTAARERAAARFDQRDVAIRSLITYAAVARRRRLGWSLT